MAWKRNAARVVLLDDDNRVFLQQSVDPANRSVPAWWELPGGGIHGGESSADGAARELVEETGIGDFEMGPCVWVRRTQFTFGGWDFDQSERIHVAWLGRSSDDIEHRPMALEFLEAAAFVGTKWWALDDL